MDLQIKGKKAIMAGGSAGMASNCRTIGRSRVELVITARREETGKCSKRFRLNTR